MKFRLIKFIIFISFLLVIASCSQKENPVSTIGIPVNTDDVVFTVINVQELIGTNEDADSSRPVKILMRIKNQEYTPLKIQSEMFTIIDDDGTHHPIIGLIFDGEEPGDERDLDVDAQLFAGALYATDEPVDNLTLSYKPTTESEPILVHFIKDDTTTEIPFTYDNLVSRLLEIDGLPDGIVAVEPQTEIPIAELSKVSNTEEPAEIVPLMLQDENEKLLGLVLVYGYASLDSVDGIFTSIAENPSRSPRLVDNLGEQAVLLNSDASLPIQQLTFTRCHVLTNILLMESGTENPISFDTLSTFTQNLDSQLSEIVCD